MNADGWRVGDRVEVGSLWARRWRVTPRPGRRGVPGYRATGHIEELAEGGVLVRFDCGPVNGVDGCCASYDELTRIGEP